MPHAADLEVQGIPGTDVQLVRFGGNELTDTSQAVKVQNDFFEMIDESDSAKFVLDLGDVIGMSGEMWGTLVAMEKRATKKGGYVRFIGLGNNLLNVMKVSKLDDVLPVYPNLQKAIGK